MSLLSKNREPFRLPVGRTDETDFFSFEGSVGPNGENRREDVIKAQTLLAKTGDFRSPFEVPTGWPSSDLFKGIKAFQTRHGKQPDGTLLPIPPGGVDENGVGESLVALRGELTDRLPGKAAPTPQQVDAHYESQARFRNTVAETASVSAQPQGAVLSDVPDAPPPQAKAGQQVALGNNVPPQRADSKPSPMAGATTRAIPDHKKDVFARPENKDVWEGYQAALHKLLPERPVLRGVLGGLYAEEGGRLADPLSGAVGGILPETLKDMRKRGLLRDLPQHLVPADLSPEQQAQVQIAYFDDVLRSVGGAAALEDLPQGVADMVGDALYLDGRGDGTRFLQQAVNAASRERELEEDGRMGPQTWAAIRRIAGDQEGSDAWLEQAARRRITGKMRSQGEIERIGRLRPARER